MLKLWVIHLQLLLQRALIARLQSVRVFSLYTPPFLIDKTNHNKLIQTYPLGYVLFAIKNGEEIITQSTSRLQKEWIVDWNSAKVITINENQISIMHPSFYSKDGERSIFGNIITASRTKRSINPVFKMFGIELFYGILTDDSNGIICLIGLKEQS